MNRKNLYFHTVASSSAEQSNPIGSVAAALQTISADQVENEPITWNYNPHAITRSESKSKPNDKNENLSYNCYSQTLNKLMGEFNEGKRKRNNNRNGDDTNAAKLIDKKSLSKNKTPWSKDDERRDGYGDSYFWSKILCNNNNSQQNDLLASTSTLSSVNSTKKSAAVNSFNISNQPNNLDINEVDAINCNINNDLNKFTLISQTALATTSSGSDLAKGTSDVNTKILESKNKNLHQDKPNFFNDKQFDNMTGNELNRMTVNNDLNAANNSFLQALSDLRLDYNELDAANGQSDRQRSSAQSQSKNRYSSSPFISKII